MRSDEAVRATDDDAASMRQSAVDKGYLTDPFASIFYPPASSGPGGPSKPPLINIGTHHRTYAIDQLVDRFFAACGEGGGQVVSLGAGSDTRFFRYMDRPHPPRIRKYIELDLPATTAAKIKHITSSPRRLPFLATRTATPNIKLHPVSTSLDPESPDSPKPTEALPTSLLSPIYTLLPIDLREAAPEKLEELLGQSLDPKVPTLLLAECVLCYLSPEVGRALIKWVGERFERSCGVIYEMLGARDAFGQVMRRNLATRGLDIPGAEPFQDLASESKRLNDPALEGGAFVSAGAKSLWDIRKSVIDKDELQRVSKLEMLDEIEELKLVLSHYMIAWGSKGDGMDAVRL